MWGRIKSTIYVDNCLRKKNKKPVGISWVSIEDLVFCFINYAKYDKNKLDSGF
jgi:hypothetical protein